MKTSSTFLGASFLVLISLPSFVLATQVLYRSPKQLGAESSLVVQGRVVEVRSYWNDSHTKIFTETTVEIDRTYKGIDRSEVRVVQMGGTVGNVRVTVHGALEWKRGQEVLLFLEDPRPGSFVVTGFSQGKFDIMRDPETGEPFVEQPRIEGVTLVGGRDAAPAAESDTPGGRVSLDRFLEHALGSK